NRATIDDPIQHSGTGLVAFTSFAFDDFSKSASLLILPRTILGRSGKVLWRTELSWVVGHPDAAAALAQVSNGSVVQTKPALVPVGNLSRVSSFWPSLKTSGFTEAVTRGTELIAQGVLEIVVLARDLKMESSTVPDYLMTLLSLAAKFRDCWTFVGSSL